MRKRLSGIFIVTALVGLALQACAPVPPRHPISDGATIQRELNDRTVVGYFTNGQSYCEYHTPNGTLIGRDTEIYAGNWRVAKDWICYAYPGSPEDCQRAYISGRSVTFYDQSGDVISRGNIVDGNVCS
ncbi:MAG: hypothetical protein ACE5GS_02585 [Kiloniellaceae bacterium]